MSTEKKATTSTPAPAQKETTKPITTKVEATPESKPVATKKSDGRKSVISAMMALSPAERVALYHELGAAIAHDSDLHSQGLVADNSKYEQL